MFSSKLFNRDIRRLIMDYAGIDYIHEKGEPFRLNKYNDKLYNEIMIWIYVPRQIAGLGLSISFTYKLCIGIHDKKDLTRIFLNRGYFGGCSAELVSKGWNRCNVLVIMMEQ